MSLTQTYYVASTARTKLGREAGRADHNLRVLVGHANLLDSLMVELADAEREQEAWFNDSVKKAGKTEEPRHVQWIDTIEESPEDEEEDSESDSDSDIYDEDAEQFAVPLRRVRSPPVTFSAMEVDEEMSEDEEDEDYEDFAYDDELALTRTPSQHAPPELMHDDSDSEDESMPSSPEQVALEYSEKERQSMITTSFYDNDKSQFVQEQQRQSPMIAAY